MLLIVRMAGLRHKIQNVTVKTSAKQSPTMPLIRPMPADCAQELIARILQASTISSSVSQSRARAKVSAFGSHGETVVLVFTLELSIRHMALRPPVGNQMSHIQIRVSGTFLALCGADGTVLSFAQHIW